MTTRGKVSVAVRDDDEISDEGFHHYDISEKYGIVSETCRVWFCTLCNNQSRVKEELGTRVVASPFARVISSKSCYRVSVISPLRALQRKWCNFEFCLARRSQKEVVLVTTTGTVQAGQVAPKDLYHLAMQVADFSCADATCASLADQVLIDKAVEEMGGYAALDADLRGAFVEAIQAAHHFTSCALSISPSIPSKTPSKDDIDMSRDPPPLEMQMSMDHVTEFLQPRDASYKELIQL
jgi:hypothetical protein